MLNRTLNQICEEYKDLMQNPIASIGVCVGMPDPNNPYLWRCTMIGPSDSSFAGGLFYLKIQFPKDYPQSAPEVLFVTPIYHINVNHIAQQGCPLGHICLSTLNYWKEKTPFSNVMTSIFALFYNQNPNDPYSREMAKEFVENRAEYDRKAKEWTQKYASMN